MACTCCEVCVIGLRASHTETRPALLRYDFPQWNFSLYFMAILPEVGAADRTLTTC